LRALGLCIIRPTPSLAFRIMRAFVFPIHYFENVHYQYRQGLYDEAEFSTQEDAWRRFLIYSGSNEIQHGIIAKAQLGM